MNFSFLHLIFFFKVRLQGKLCGNFHSVTVKDTSFIIKLLTFRSSIIGIKLAVMCVRV